MKTVLVIVNANNRIGMGHLSRCIELSKNLKKLNLNPYFLIENEILTKKIIQEANFEFFTIDKFIEKDLISILKKLKNKINLSGIIIDSRKKFGSKFFLEVNKICKTVVIWNEKNYENFNADLIILPEIEEQYSKKIINKRKNILVGSKYVMLGNKSKSSIKQKKSILITMGGSDKKDLTIKIIKNLKKSKKQFRANIIVGRYFKKFDKISNLIKDDFRFNLIHNSNNLIKIMQCSTIGIFTMGITTYEALYSGLPSIIISHSKENDRAAKKLSNYNCIKYLGYYKNVNFEKISDIIFKFYQNKKVLKIYSTNGKELVDGEGTARISKKIKELLNS